MKRFTPLTSQEKMLKHFDARSKERLGGYLSDEELAEIIHAIKVGRAQPIKKWRHGRGKYLVAIKGEIRAVVFDFKYNTMVTVFPADDPETIKATQFLSWPLQKWLAQHRTGKDIS